MVPLLCDARPCILFDLDGTLLPMDMEQYIQRYFSGLSQCLAHIAPDVIYKMLWEGIGAMMGNESGRANREVFADVFTARTGVDYYQSEPLFLEFYQTGYQQCLASCQPTDLAGQIVKTLQKKGYTLVLATSPLYPAIATQARIRWAGLDPKDFQLITTFEDFHCAKPHPRYYLEICEKLRVSPQDCLLIGNDAEEDGVAAQTGMQVILTTDCLINKKNLPTANFALGTLRDVLIWAQQAPALV